MEKRLRTRSKIANGLLLLFLAAPVTYAVAGTEAPAGFGGNTNGFTTQTQLDLDREVFEEREGISDGLGPVYNAQGCSECHQNPVAGATSQVSVIRVGRFDGRRYQDRPGGSLIQDRAIDPAIQERASAADNVQTFRMSLSVLGDGFVEAISDRTLEALQASQPTGMKGTLIRDPFRPACVFAREWSWRSGGKWLLPGGLPRASIPVMKTGLHDFDFLAGHWQVHHRRLKERLAGSREWVEFDGTCTAFPLMDGWANADDNVLEMPGGEYRAVTLRSYDQETGQWAIWWLDGRFPLGPLEPPVKGRFENGAGTFYADDTFNGKPIRIRFIWSQITPTSARWEQAFSPDGGKTWETNWQMEFRRTP